MRYSKKLTTLVALAGIGMLASATQAGAAVSPRYVGWSEDYNTVTPNNRNTTLESSACPNSSLCFAVGTSTDWGGNGPRRVLERWNGSYWSIVNTPAPAGATTSSLHDVRCVGTSFCIAVGATNRGAFVLRFNGSSWSVMSAPSPGSGATLRSVACPSTTSCFAVGSSSNGRLLEKLSGGTWTVQNTPGTAGVTFNDIACASTTSCMIVGENWPSPVVERLVNGQWKMMTAPAPSNRTAALASVACPSTTSCLAVGATIGRTDGSTRRYAVRFNGTNWASEFTPLPDDSETGRYESDYFTGVSCTTVNYCAAVGSYNSWYGRTGLAESYSYGSWDIDNNPQWDASLANVNCAPSYECLAVGSLYSSAYVQRGYL